MAGFDYSCDWKAGFVMDPTKKQRVGYLTAMSGLGMTGFLDNKTEAGGAGIKVFTPYNVSGNSANYKGITLSAGAQDSGGSVGTSAATVNCVGMIEHFSFAGGVGDPICVSAYISAQNQVQIKGKLQTTLQSTIVNELGWWIVNFDEENKVWFEESFPLSNPTISAQINAVGGKDVRLHVSDEPVKIAANIDINVYNMYFEVVPAANATFALQFSSSSKTKYARGWGLQVGSNAAAAMPTK